MKVILPDCMANRYSSSEKECLSTIKNSRSSGAKDKPDHPTLQYFSVVGLLNVLLL